MEFTDFDKFNHLKDNTLFAFVDIETTGFSPQRGDKILEISIITTDLQGNILDEYETLINPCRDVSAGQIHGITAQMVKDAPKIDEVLDDIIYHLKNKTIVGHNIDFDLRFLNHELSKYLKEEIHLVGICTLKLSKQIVPGLPSRKLESFCLYYDIDVPSNHSASCDCKATLELFHIFREKMLKEMQISHFLQSFSCPVCIQMRSEPAKISYKRSDAGSQAEKSKSRLMNMVLRLPVNLTDALPVQQYLNLLDDILADRLVTESETEMLFHFLDDFQISRQQALEIHLDYVRKLTRIYLFDNILTTVERNDLDVVSGLLGVDQAKLSEIIEFEKAKIALQKIDHNQGEVHNLAGKSVCFTGELISKHQGMMIDRTMAQQFAMERGLIIKAGVSKNLDFLVTADPNSLSGKSKKAREMGIKIIAEPVFWNMLGIAVE